MKNVTVTVMAGITILSVVGSFLKEPKIVERVKIVEVEKTDVVELKAECVKRADMIKTLCDATGYLFHSSNTNWDGRITIVLPTTTGEQTKLARRL